MEPIELTLRIEPTDRTLRTDPVDNTLSTDPAAISDATLPSPKKDNMLTKDTADRYENEEATDVPAVLARTHRSNLFSGNAGSISASAALKWTGSFGCVRPSVFARMW